MGRKNLAPLRTAEILNAFDECVARDGLSGTSLDDVAREAGVAKRVVLHYFGSRAALVRAAVERVAESYCSAFENIVEGEPESRRLETMLDWMFLGDFNDARTCGLVIDLFGEGLREPELRAILLEAFEALQADIASEIARARGVKVGANVRRAAFLISSLCCSSSDFVALGFPASRARDARKAADLLIDSCVPAAQAVPARVANVRR